MPDKFLSQKKKKGQTRKHAKKENHIHNLTNTGTDDEISLIFALVEMFQTTIN